MGFWTVALSTVLYLLTAAARAWERDWPGAVIWGGYAVANVGFMLAYWGR